MFEGKIAKGLAMANAAILIGLIEELIERRVMARACARELFARSGQQTRKLSDRRLEQCRGRHRHHPQAVAAANFRTHARGLARQAAIRRPGTLPAGPRPGRRSRLPTRPLETALARLHNRQRNVTEKHL